MFRKTASLATPLLLLGLMCTAVSALATTYHVAKTGNDSGTCTASQPCLTITRAKNLATQPGDIVQMGPGTYNERVTITANGSEAGGKIIFRGHDGSGCPKTPTSDINHPTGTRPSPAVITTGGFNIQGDYVKLDCFKVVAAKDDAIEINVPNVHHVDITNNFVDGAQGTTGTAIYLGGNVPYAAMPDTIYVANNYITQTGYGFLMHCRNCLLEFNEVFDAPHRGEDYARAFGDTITFRRNYFHGANVDNCPDCHIDCFQAFDVTGNEQSTNITIDGNVCFNSHQGVIHRNTARSPNHFNWVIKNNVFAHGPKDGHPWCILLENIWTASVLNNTCVGGVSEARGPMTVEYRNNIFYNTFGAYQSVGGATIIGNKNLIFRPGSTFQQSDWPNDILNKDPLFVDRAGDDYHLQAGSPATDAAEKLGSVATDLQGGQRPVGPAYDIGAYEFDGVGSARPAPPTGLRGTVR